MKDVNMTIAQLVESRQQVVELEPAELVLYLPRCEESIQPLPPFRERRDLPPGDETILLVEDDDHVREMVRLALEREGYRVLDAANGQQALRLALAHSGPIHLLVTDVIMPGINGQALANSLVQAHPDLKTLYITGYPEEMIEQYGVLDPGVSLLQKPFSLLDLVGKVRAVLDIRNPL
jgi:CheY-like chemotaxis protein